MIGYLDTAAFVPLLIAGPTSAACRRFWDLADDVVSSRLLYVETAAALAQAHRMRRLTTSQHRKALMSLDEMCAEVDVVELDAQLVVAAARLAHDQALRGYDAVHCASAQAIADQDLVAASGDRKLLAAWRAIGVSTYDTSAPDD